MNKKTLSTRAIAYVALFIAMQLVLEVLFKVIPDSHRVVLLL